MIDVKTGKIIAFNDGIHMHKPICPECNSGKICYQRKITEEDRKDLNFRIHKCAECGFKFG